MKRKLSDFFSNFMSGRYGTDDLSKFSLAVCLVLLIINIFTSQPIVYILALALLVWSYFRMFSRNYVQRSAENEKYMNFVQSIRGRFGKAERRAKQSKDYHIYKCPSCGQKIRIPRGKGKICITCPKCRKEFQKRS
ncbi:MAG: hypothetical protein LIP12_05575 [Clostridiales bacterium]|nr:hypothetical protein [Clostridiales bacterium]MCC8065657.1 hypothetical protein [Clostridiales bacterium]